MLPRIVNSKLISILALLSFALPAQADDQPLPTTMTKFAVRYVADDIDPSSFGAKPRTCYRAGDVYGRVEEAPDEPLGLHGLIIIAAPDVWMINLVDLSGKHILAKSTPTRARMPILASGQIAFKDLEFGKELLFFTDKKITPTDGPTIDGTKTKSYKYSESSIDTELLVNPESEPMKLIIATQNGKRTLVYSDYKTLPFDESRFKKPENIAITDIDATADLGAEMENKDDSEDSENEIAIVETSSKGPNLGQSKKHNKEEESHYGSDSVSSSMREPKAVLKTLQHSKDLWQWMTYYYLFPEPSLTPSALHLLEEEDALDKENVLPPISSFLSRVFLQNPDKIHEWVSQAPLTEEHKKGLLPLVLRLTRLPAAITEAEEIEKTIPSADRVITHLDLSPDKLDTFYISSPSDLDMFWGCFLATGDKRYVEKIITTVPWSKKLTGSINKISIGAAAVWSLTSNAQQHKRVLQILKEVSAAKPELQYDLNKIIEKAEKAN